MDKREKVLKGLEICKEESKLCFGESECGYQSYFPRCWITLAADALALLKALDVTPEELERLKKCRHECKIDCLLEHYEKIKAERDALLKEQEPQWTPITFRPLTEEEKAEHPDWCYIIDGPTPDDGEEILVSDGRYVWADAWMKMPTPWRKEVNT